jgi:hypothetical protein
MQLSQSNKKKNQEEGRDAHAKYSLLKSEREIELGTLHARAKQPVFGKVAWPV